jgi:hypothetical protein
LVDRENRVTSASKLTRLPDGCDLCSDGDDHVLHLHAKCHIHAPLRLAYQGARDGGGVVEIRCYVPNCAQNVATFSVGTVIFPWEMQIVPNDCDLCNDNDAWRFRERAVVNLTAPFRLECRRTTGGQRVLCISCYVEECDRLFAVLALTEATAMLTSAGETELPRKEKS